MPHHKPNLSKQDRLCIHAISRCAARNGSHADSEPPGASTVISVPFQFVADFQVEASNATEFLEDPDLSPQARSLFLAIIRTPEALNRICHVAILCDGTEDSGCRFKGKLAEPDREDILDAILSYLPAELKEYWIRLQQQDSDSFDFYIDRIFQQFQSSLVKIEFINMTTGESTPLWVNSGIQPDS